MPSNKSLFHALHTNQNPLVLTNIWDAASALLAEQAGAKAVATSSAALAWSLGYADGYQLPPQKLFQAIENIARVVRVPLTVDIENGYSDAPEKVAQLSRDLIGLGVAGINIEDGIEPPQLLSNKIQAIRSEAKDLFINARTDVYLQALVAPEMRVKETLSRQKLYADAGADGLFVPGLSQAQEIAAITAESSLPVNLMVAPGNAGLAEFKQLGVARLSNGPMPFLQTYSLIAKWVDDSHQSNQALSELSFEHLNLLMIQANQHQVQPLA